MYVFQQFVALYISFELVPQISLHMHVGILVTLGVLDLQGRDILRYTEIVFKPPALVQAGHSAYLRKNTKRSIRKPIECGDGAIGVPRDIPACK